MIFLYLYGYVSEFKGGEQDGDLVYNFFEVRLILSIYFKQLQIISVVGFYEKFSN